MKQHLGRIWFASQAVAVASWWLLLLVRPGLRPLFSIRDAPAVSLGAFAPGDLLLIGLGSALVAFSRNRSWTVPMGWMVAGAVLYGAIYCLTLAVSGDAQALGALLMVPAAVFSIAAALAISRDRSGTVSSRPSA
jgi:hypothetical protein